MQRCSDAAMQRWARASPISGSLPQVLRCADATKCSYQPVETGEPWAPHWTARDMHGWEPTWKAEGDRSRREEGQSRRITSSAKLKHGIMG